MMNPTDELKTRYLETIRDIVVAVHRRDGILSRDLCVTNNDAPEPDALKSLANVNRDIERGCATMRQVEAQGGGAFGVQTLLGQDVDDSIRIAVSILAGQVLCAEVCLHDVARLGDLAAGATDNVTERLSIHEAFRRTGILRPHVSFRLRGASNISEAVRPSLKETAFRTLIGLGADPEIDEIDRAAAVVGRG